MIDLINEVGATSYPHERKQKGTPSLHHINVQIPVIMVLKMNQQIKENFRNC
jgi:hypothetical protein